MTESKPHRLLIIKALLATLGVTAIVIATIAIWQWSLVANYRGQLLRLRNEGVADAYYNATDEQYVIELDELPYRQVAEQIVAPRGLLPGFVPKLDIRGFDVADITALSGVMGNVQQLELKGAITKAKELEALLTHFPNIAFIQTGEIAWSSDLETILVEFDRPLTIIAVTKNSSDEKLPNSIGTKVYIQWFYRNAESLPTSR